MLKEYKAGHFVMVGLCHFYSISWSRLQIMCFDATMTEQTGATLGRPASVSDQLAGFRDEFRSLFSPHRGVEFSSDIDLLEQLEESSKPQPQVPCLSHANP